MIKSKQIIQILTFVISINTLFIQNVNAANASLSWFSRANCQNNESISWDGSTAHWLATITYHYRNGYYQHCDDSNWTNCNGSPWQLTWRSAAIHWFEDTNNPGGWYVIGDHYRWSPISGIYRLGVTTAANCNANQW